MKTTEEYLTGNRGLDTAIARSLAKEQEKTGKRFAVLPSAGLFSEKRGKYQVAPEADRRADGILFDSKLEKDRYLELKMMQKTGEIRDLELQKRFVLIDDFLHMNVKYRGVSYYADFFYLDMKNKEIPGMPVIEEWKVQPTRTKDYIIKMKLMMTRYSYIEFREMVKK